MSTCAVNERNKWHMVVHTLKVAAFFVLSGVSSLAFASGKGSYTRYNKIIEVKGTPYMVAMVDNYSKMYSNSGSEILIINTLTGEKRKIELPEGSKVGKLEQLHVDSLGINKLLLTARTINVDGNKGIDWQDPTQIFILSPDGKDIVQITDNRFYDGVWALNERTGTILIAGRQDSNNNARLDNEDESELFVFDLRKMKRIVN
jgi:hypothetical protein